MKFYEDVLGIEVPLRNSFIIINSLNACTTNIISRSNKIFNRSPHVGSAEASAEFFKQNLGFKKGNVMKKICFGR